MKQFLIVLLVCPLLAPSCRKPAEVSGRVGGLRWVNTDHLLSTLYRPVRLAANGAGVGTIWIYAEPDSSGYKLVADDDEGFTCVDDVARAGLFLMRESDLLTNPDKQETLRQLVRFVVEMQSPTGYFYNFLWLDKTINTTFRTSQNVPNWWSWRALWLLSEAYPTLQRLDAPLASRVQTAIDRVVAVTVRDFGLKAKAVRMVQGVTVPTWLPYGSGSDQAAIMLLGLTNVYGRRPTEPVRRLIDQLAEGVLLMQKGDRHHYPYGAFLSFETNWHAYGNDQAYALLTVGKALNRPDWVAAARREVESFYPYLLREGFLESFGVRQSGDTLTEVRRSNYAQIAYGVRPMIWATLALYEQTNDARLLDQAAQLTRWFLGNNPARAVMYDRATGRGYDGISSASIVSRNAGAESTIEALLAFQWAERYMKLEQKTTGKRDRLTNTSEQ